MGQPVVVRAALALLAAAVLALAVGSMRDDSATADEAAHIAAGLLKLREGRIEFYKTQAPLTEVLIATPLAMRGYAVPEEWRQYENRPWVAGHILLYRSPYDPQRVLTLARLPIIALFLALCFAVFWFVREASGNAYAGLAAFALTGFCPTLLAHGRLATVDMGLTFFAFLATALFVRLWRKPSAWVAIACGAALACAIASKVSGVILIPVFAIVFLFRGGDWRRRTPYLFAAALLTFCAIYMFIARSADPTIAFRAFVSEVTAVRSFYADRHVLPQFLLGQLSPDGWPHYYLVAIAVKTPIAALLLFFAIRARRFEAIVCLVFIALFLIVSSFSSLNLGIRHVLPIYPFLYSAVAISLADASKRVRIVGGALVAAHVLTGALAYPSYISYFNPLIGSHRNADRVLIDSNLDWGQDLRRLRKWTERNHIAHIRVHYFGGGNVEREFGTRGERWSAPRAQPLPKGWFAVSRHFYRLSFFRSRMNYDAYLAASKARYVTTIGGSIDVYRVE